MHQYKLISKKGEGTFSEVLKAKSLKTDKFAAIKCMKNHFTSIEQVNHLREIQALRKLSPHEHIIKLIEILYDEPTGRLALVFELFDQNLYEHIKGKKQYLNPQKIKYYIYQLVKAIDHMHRNGIFHRDIKPENILLLGDHIKLADFGSCKGMFSEHPYTEYISTRWYRAPECLLTDGYYDFKMDMWGVGCVMFEIIGLFPIFPGNNELDQVHKIHNILGTPDQNLLDRFQKHATHMEFNFPPQKGTGIDKLLPNIAKDCIDLIKQLLAYDPEDRITASAALRHEYFRELFDMDSSMKEGHQNVDRSVKQERERSNDTYHGYNKSIKKNTVTSFSNPNKKKIDKAYTGTHGLETSTEEDMDKLFLPPIQKNQIHVTNPMISMGSSQYYGGQTIKKQYEQKKMYGGGNVLKSNLSNQYLKKAKKGSHVYQQPADYVIYGKKAQITNN